MVKLVGCGVKAKDLRYLALSASSEPPSKDEEATEPTSMRGKRASCPVMHSAPQAI